jgi:hypothetical protein
MSTPLRSTDPVEQACVVLRSMKFRLRSPELDASQVVAWIRDELPEDWAAHVPDLAWRRLVMARRWSVLPELKGRDELAVAGELGQKAVQLVLEIRKRA